MSHTETDPRPYTCEDVAQLAAFIGRHLPGKYAMHQYDQTTLAAALATEILHTGYRKHE